jgi:anthranilate phosphoribosyltransferase
MTSDLNDLKPILAIVADGGTLTSAQAETAFDTIMSGDATPAQVGAFLMALRLRGETVDEITAAARVMRSKALAITAPAGAIDVVGTGGDGAGTLNISTGAAIVVAGAGVKVAKHGNRALSSRAGAADVLAALGVDIDADMRLIERSIAEAGIGFMMAPRHHSATRHVAGPRVELAIRTVFNLLGPLSNPAGVTRLLVGVYDEKWVEPMARVLGNLGAERAWVVHGSGGLDELTTIGPTSVAEYHGGEVRIFEVTPEDAGLARGALADLKGGDGEFNAEALRAVLNGAPGVYRDTVLLTAGGALIVAGKADDIRAGVALAAESVETGRALAALERMVEITNQEIVVDDDGQREGRTA